MRMEEPEAAGAGLIATAVGLVVGLVVYLLVAPFDCNSSGFCEGLVAFQYQPDSAGHWQAIGAGAVVGGSVALLLWAALAPEGPIFTIIRVVLTMLLVGGIGISLLSQSILIIVGPLLGGLFLWLIWGSGRRARRLSEPGPFYSRR